MMHYAKKALLFLALLGLMSCALIRPQAEPPKISLADVGVLSFGIFEQRYALTLRLQNPNAFAIPIQGMTYTLQFNDEVFAEGVAAPEADIPGYGEALIQTEAVSNLGGLMSHLRSLEQGEGLRYRLSGKIDLGGFSGRVPFQHEGDLVLPGLGR